ncbi:Antigenic determinant of rec-A protein [Musa troglodytarum]|uniref:KIN17-like protein n=1 Tax=Musa troglodytarum TaxID=320322 RepID=A0A9E7F821_9LILI|nr:Antigenic determinant of rec-A protein [Musa troglodytarum]
MGKNEFLTPKAIANRIKAKGLQKLRWYCQMCQKQCRDENGFKCHCLSESHQRQMQVFGQNPTRIVEGYSEEFERAFLDLVRRSHRFSRVAATVVYNEYIADRHHVHMNSTRWATLTEFVKHLGRAGFCKVEDTPKGWFITYIDRDSETVFKNRLKAKRLRADLVDEERQERAIAHQIERATSLLPSSSSDPVPSETPEAATDPNPSAPIKSEPGGKIAFSLQPATTSSKSNVAGESTSRIPKLGFDEGGQERSERKDKKNDKSAPGGGGGLSALDELIREEEKAKERSNRKDYWLCEGIVVKVMSKTLADKGYYKQKGSVKRVIDKYVGEIEMLESKHVLRVDQEELETVIPQIGGLVRIVNGAYRGSNARLLSVDTERYCAKVQIEKGSVVTSALKHLTERCLRPLASSDRTSRQQDYSSPMSLWQSCTPLRLHETWYVSGLHPESINSIRSCRLAEEATRTKPWPPRDTRTLRVISRAAFEVDDFWRVADVLHKRFKRFDRKRWRKAYKAMILLEHLLTHGPLSFADELQSDKEVIQRMCNFQYVDERGYNWGLTVKKKAERVLKLLEKGPFLEEERDRLRKATRGIEGFDSFNVSWPLTITVEEATQNHGISLQRQQDDARTEEKPSKEDSDENGGCSVGMKVHPAEELIPLLSCEEGRKIEVLSHQLS